jgi:hypothetical protein
LISEFTPQLQENQSSSNLITTSFCVKGMAILQNWLGKNASFENYTAKLNARIAPVVVAGIDKIDVLI